MRGDFGREPLGYDIGPDDELGFFNQTDGTDDNEDHTFMENNINFDRNSRRVSRGSNHYWHDSYVGVPKYYYELHRLRTFTASNWKQSYPVRPADLAKNGFIYFGPGDRVKCVFCQKTLYHWEQGDTVEEEHRRHYPSCAFVKGECEQLNVPIISEENMEAGLRLSLKRENTISSDAGVLDQATAYKTQPELPTRKLPLEMLSNFSDRLASFRSWPRHFSQSKPSPDQLAGAGFYYFDKEDHVRCFSCARVCQNWTSLHDPWVEHARKSPICNYVINVKGSDFVKRVTSQPELNNLNQGISKMTIFQETESPMPGRFRQGENPISDKQESQSRSFNGKLKNSAKGEDNRDKNLIAAFQDIFDVPESLIRQTLADVRKIKGPYHVVTSKDLAKLLN